MNTRVFPRRFITAITLALATAGLAFAPVHAVDRAQWSDTDARSNVLVQDCRGASVLSGFSPNLAFGLDFEISTSYRIDRYFTLFTDHSGTNHPAIERQVVSIVGVMANSETGHSLAYDGHYTRTSILSEGDVTISDLALNLLPSDQEGATVTLERDTSGVIDSPEAMLLAFAPSALQMSLCHYFAGITAGE
jgi:hypothetical protein